MNSLQTYNEMNKEIEEMEIVMKNCPDCKKEIKGYCFPHLFCIRQIQSRLDGSLDRWGEELEFLENILDETDFEEKIPDKDYWKIKNRIKELKNILEKKQ